MAFTPSSPPFPAADASQRPSRYPGEDTTPTSRREILGWYAYGIAAEVFAVCGVGRLFHHLKTILALRSDVMVNANYRFFLAPHLGTISS